MNCPPRIGEEICALYESSFLKALETLNMAEKTSAVSLITGDAVKSIGKYIVQKKNVGGNFIVFLVKVFLLILLFPVIFCDSMLLVSNMLLIFFHRMNKMNKILMNKKTIQCLLIINIQ